MDSVTVPIGHHQKINDNQSTGSALGRAAKCFGRNVCKMAVAVPYVLYQAFSITTEALCGAGGAVVGTVRGGTVKLVRAAGAKLGLCQKSTKPLSEYIIQDFHRGANVGWLPGQIVGVAGSALTTIELLNPISLGVGGIILGMHGLAEGVTAYNEIKFYGHSCTEDYSKNILRDIRRECRDIHDWLYGEKNS